MQAPKKAASSDNTGPRKLTSAEFFGAPVRYVSAPKVAKDNMPEWYYDWLGADGLTQDFIVWYESWEAIEIFGMFQFQWLHGSSGITGLNYAPIIAWIDLRHARKSARLQLLLDINALEFGAMTAFNEIRRAAEEKAEQERAKTK